MQGAALPLKEVSRALLFRRFSDYSFVELLKGTFGMGVPRAENILWSHKGFDHVRLFNRLKREFSLESNSYSPFPNLPWWLNSQAFYVFSGRKRVET
jgi:hypothetical protein